MADYKSSYKGEQIDNAVSALMNVDNSATKDTTKYAALVRPASDANVPAPVDGEIIQGYVPSSGALANKPMTKGSGVNIDSIKVVKAGVTNAGYIMMSDLPGLDVMKSSIKVFSNGSGSGAPILYFGRNFCDIANIKSLRVITNILGQRNTELAMLSGAAYYTPKSGDSETGYAADTTLSNALSSAKRFEVRLNHQYLVVARFNVGAETSLAPSNFALYDGSTSIASAAPTAGTATSNTVDFYAVLTPTWSYSSNANDAKTNTALIIQDGNGTAVTTEELSEVMILDLTEICDDSYVKTAADAYAKYAVNNYTPDGQSSPLFDLLVAGTAATYYGSKFHGPAYAGATQGYFIPYSRNWYITVPIGVAMYIQQFKYYNSSLNRPVQYLRTQKFVGADGQGGTKISVSVGGVSTYIYAFKVTLDQEITLGQQNLIFFYGTAGDTTKPSIITSGNENEGNAPLFQYLPTEDQGLSTNQLHSQFPWVVRKKAINLSNGQYLANNSVYDSDGYTTWSWNQSKTYNLKEMLNNLGIDDTEIGKEGVYGIGSISFQSTSGAFYWSVSRDNPIRIDSPTNPGTNVSYSIDSVNSAILSLDQKISNINNSSLLSTLPTAVGTYKYQVTSEGTPGTWAKEEETVHTLNTKFSHAQTTWTELTDKEDEAWFKELAGMLVAKTRSPIPYINFINAIYNWPLCYGSLISYERNQQTMCFGFGLNATLFVLEVRQNNSGAREWRAVQVAS